MKKLMIAAAAAAMIGVAEASTLAYDYTTSLKTTKGKGGSQTTQTCNLGMDNVGTFWYEDGAVSAYYQIKKDAAPATGYHKEDIFTGANLGAIDVTDLKTTKGVLADFGPYEAVITFTQNKFGYIGKLNANFNALENWEKEVFANYAGPIYNQKSDNKWCVTFKYKAGAQCYRATTTIKQKAVLFVNDCCNDEYVDDDNNFVVKFVLNNRFGATTLAKATKVEVCGYVNDFCDAASQDQYTLAGQGTWSDKLAKRSDKTYDVGIKNISGNIVGVLEAPNCEQCCQNPMAAIAWPCDDTTDDATLPTAAFGSFSLKFNKSKSVID